jgi:hypothetical protein
MSFCLSGRIKMNSKLKLSQQRHNQPLRGQQPKVAMICWRGQQLLGKKLMQ